MDIVLTTFIQANHLLSFATLSSTDNTPYIANCFYAFDMENLVLIIKSSPDSAHIKYAIQNPQIALCIATTTKNISHIKGAQIKATLLQANKEQKDIYYMTFPFARVVSGKVYALRIEWAKYTDNSLPRNTKIEFVR